MGVSPDVLGKLTTLRDAGDIMISQRDDKWALSMKVRVGVVAAVEDSFEEAVEKLHPLYAQAAPITTRDDPAEHDRS